MGVPTYATLSDLILDALGANVATAAPFTAAEILRFFNDAYQTVWEIEGGGIKTATGSAAWTPAPTVATDGKLTGILTTIEEIEAMWATVTVGSTGGGSVDTLLRRVEAAELDWHRAHTAGMGTYSVPRLFAISRLATAVDADVNKVQADVWPGVAGLYFPIKYVPQFTPLDNSTILVPDLTDLGARDAYLIAAMKMAPLIGEAELVPGLAMQISDRTQQALERKASYGAEGKQDRP